MPASGAGHGLPAQYAGLSAGARQGRTQGEGALNPEACSGRQIAPPRTWNPVSVSTRTGQSMVKRKESLMDSEAAIRQLADKVDAAYNDAEPAKMASYWTENGLNVNPFGDRFEGRPSIEADLRDGLNGFMKGSRHELTIIHVCSLDERTAVADGTATITGILGFDGTTMEPLTSDFSMICTRDDGGVWQIAQMRAYRFIPKQG